MKRSKARPTPSTPAPSGPTRPKERCGLCGKGGPLTKTECCGNTICDDENTYVPFSHPRNSCLRNHRRYTLCGSHSAQEHAGSWQACPDCRADFETELYVYYGTNDFNFVKLESPPTFKPTLCSSCRRRINLGEDGYTLLPTGKYLCEPCGSKRTAR